MPTTFSSDNDQLLHNPLTHRLSQHMCKVVGVEGAHEDQPPVLAGVDAAVVHQSVG